MYPHPNTLPRWLKTLLLASGALLIVTGGLWLWLHYGLGAGSDEGALPHPWEAGLMRAHGLGVIVFLFALGGLGPVHIPRGWRERRSLRSGLTLAACALLLAASGYGLYYWVSEAQRPLLGWLHSAVGAVMGLVFALHWRARTTNRR